MISKSTKEMFFKYRAIIIAVIIFMICDFVVMGTNFYSSFRISESAVSINLSGRQRMLSQRTTKALLSLQEDVAKDLPQEDDLRELALVVELFDSTLKGFRDGRIVTGGSGNPVYLTQVNTDISRKVIEDAYIIWDPYFEKLQPLLKSPNFSKEELAGAVAYARANNLILLNLMNNLTNDLEYVANQRAERLRFIQVAGLLIALLNVLYTLFKSISDLMRRDRELEVARRETEEILGTVKEGLSLLDVVITSKKH